MSTIWNQITFKYQTINRKIFISTFQCEIENLKNCFGNYVTCNMNNQNVDSYRKCQTNNKMLHWTIIADTTKLRALREKPITSRQIFIINS